MLFNGKINYFQEEETHRTEYIESGRTVLNDFNFQQINKLRGHLTKGAHISLATKKVRLTVRSGEKCDLVNGFRNNCSNAIIPNAKLRTVHRRCIRNVIVLCNETITTSIIHYFILGSR